MTDQPNADPKETPKPETTPLTLDTVKEVVKTALADSKKPPEGGDEPNPEGDYLADPGQGGQPAVDPQGGYDPYNDPNSPYYTGQQPPPNQEEGRVEAIEKETLSNRDVITTMKFKSDLDDMIDEDPSLRPYRKEALKLQTEYLKLGQSIAPDTMINLIEGRAVKKKRMEDKVLSTNTGEGDLQPTGENKPKHPMDQTKEELLENYGDIRF